MGWKKEIAKYADDDTVLATELVGWMEAQQRYEKACKREEKTGHPIDNEGYYDRDDNGVAFAHAVQPFIQFMVDLRPRVEAALANSTAETPESDVLAEILEQLEKRYPA